MWSVGISVSPCADATRIGYDERQINRIVIRMAQYFLDRNMRVIFGHDWREDGVMRAVANFAEAVAARRAEAREEETGHLQPENREEPRMLNVVPTGRAPLSRTAREAQRLSGGVLEVIPLNEVEEYVHEPVAAYQHKHHDNERARELTNLRREITKRLAPGCRVCLVGKTSGYEGREPGVQEEAQFALDYNKPLYLMGGFGGATRNFGTMNDSGVDYWCSANGLDHDEKRELFETTDLEHALRLIASGIQPFTETVQR